MASLKNRNILHSISAIIRQIFTSIMYDTSICVIYPLHTMRSNNTHARTLASKVSHFPCNHCIRFSVLLERFSLYCSQSISYCQCPPSIYTTLGGGEHRSPHSFCNKTNTSLRCQQTHNQHAESEFYTVPVVTSIENLYGAGERTRAALAPHHTNLRSFSLLDRLRKTYTRLSVWTKHSHKTLACVATESVLCGNTLTSKILTTQ